MRTLWMALALAMLVAASSSGAETAAPAAPAASATMQDQWGNMADWFAFEAPQDDFSPSAIDCSRLIPAPTGQHGFVKVQGDHFAFEDGTPVRFWGVEFGPGRLTDSEYAIKRLRKHGINLVRQHGMGGFTVRGSESVLQFDEASFDRWDAFIAELGKQGVYICLDADYYMRVGPKDVPGLPQGGATQFLMFVDKTVADVKRQRFKGIFTHLNKYTGKRWCDDPTLALVEIVNEDSIFWHGVDTLPEPFKTELEGKFKDWLTKRYGDEAALRTAWTFEGNVPLAEGEGLDAADRMAMLPMWRYEERPAVEFAKDQKRAIDQLRFFLELENAYYAETYQYMRDFGMKAPICATNWRGGGFSNRVHVAGQARLDYVDRHGYWDHPQGEGNSKWNIATSQFTNLPMVKALIAGQDPAQENNVGNLILSKGWEQVLGKPLGVSEWNTCLPNEYSLEGAGLMAAYGLLQGWDAPIQSAINGSDYRRTLGPSSFDMHCNPPQFLEYPAVAMMWLRGGRGRGAPCGRDALHAGESVRVRSGPPPAAVGRRLRRQGRLQLRGQAARARGQGHQRLLGREEPDGQVHHGRAGLEREGRARDDRHGPHGGRHRLPEPGAADAQVGRAEDHHAVRRGLRHRAGRRQVGRAGRQAAGDGRRPGAQHGHGVRADQPARRAVRHVPVAAQAGRHGAHHAAGHRGRTDDPHGEHRQAEGVGAGHERQAQG